MVLRSDPAISVDEGGLLVLSWPLGRSGVVEVEASVLEDLVERANLGRRAITVLGVIAQAIATLVTSPADNATTGAPTQPVDTP